MRLCQVCKIMHVKRRFIIFSCTLNRLFLCFWNESFFVIIFSTNREILANANLNWVWSLITEHQFSVWDSLMVLIVLISPCAVLGLALCCGSIDMIDDRLWDFPSQITRSYLLAGVSSAEVISAQLCALIRCSWIHIWNRFSAQKSLQKWIHLEVFQPLLFSSLGFHCGILIYNESIIHKSSIISV